MNALHARAFGGVVVVAAVPWRRRLERHALTWVGAFDGGLLVGFVQVAWDGGEHAFLLDTAVDPDRQRLGVGVALVRRAVEDVAAAGCSWLHVDFEPHLDGFYLGACGFRRTDAGLLRVPPTS